MMKVHLQEAVKFVLSSAGLAAFCLCADHIVFKWEDKWKKLAYGVALRAVTDSLVHGVVGGWCWMNVILVLGEQFTTVRVMQIAACVAMATSIDVDHFIAAKSLSFKDALNLPKRPFAHNTTLIIIGAALLYLLVYLSTPLLGNRFIKDLPLMFVISTLSHHLRDADRRGIWLGPFFSTPPIPYKLYPFLITLLPTVLPLPRLLPVFFKALVEMSAVFMRPKTPPEISNV